MHNQASESSSAAQVAKPKILKEVIILPSERKEPFESAENEPVDVVQVSAHPKWLPVSTDRVVPVRVNWDESLEEKRREKEGEEESWKKKIVIIRRGRNACKRDNIGRWIENILRPLKVFIKDVENKDAARVVCKSMNEKMSYWKEEKNWKKIWDVRVRMDKCGGKKEKI